MTASPALGTRPDHLAPDDTVGAVIQLAIELGTDRPDVTTVAAELVNFAQADHRLLRAARSALIERLHQRSADLDATRGLRVVEEGCGPPLPIGRRGIRLNGSGTRSHAKRI